MADKATIRVKMDMTQEVRDLLKDLSKIDAESKTKLKDEVASISRWTAQGIIEKSYNAPMPRQAAVVASTVRPNKDRIPNVTIGGSSGRRTSTGTPAGVLVIGSEFGASPTSENGAFPNGGRRFPYRSAREGRGNKGYWIFPALKEMQPEISRRWWTASEAIFRHWQRFG